MMIRYYVMNAETERDITIRDSAFGAAIASTLYDIEHGQYTSDTTTDPHPDDIPGEE